MSRAPEVSVVIPVWGRYAGPDLAEALKGILAQDPRPHVVLVDNASEPAVEADGDVEIVRMPSRVSVGAARRAGLDHSHTPWTVFWDADDVMLPGTLSRLLAATREQPDVVAVTPAIVDGVTAERHHWPRPWTRRFARFRRAFALVNTISSLYPTSGALVDTAATKAAGGHPDAHGGDDWTLGVSLAFRGRVVLLTDLGRVYNFRAGSISAKWRAVPDISGHAALVRRRVRHDPAVPAAVRRALPLIALLQWAVILVARPLSRALPSRRRARRPTA